jgi:hypothetical protein
MSDAGLIKEEAIVCEEKRLPSDNLQGTHATLWWIMIPMMRSSTTF